MIHSYFFFPSYGIRKVSVRDPLAAHGGRAHSNSYLWYGWFLFVDSEKFCAKISLNITRRSLIQMVIWK